MRHQTIASKHKCGSIRPKCDVIGCAIPFKIKIFWVFFSCTCSILGFWHIFYVKCCVHKNDGYAKYA